MSQAEGPSQISQVVLSDVLLMTPDYGYKAKAQSKIQSYPKNQAQSKSQVQPS